MLESIKKVFSVVMLWLICTGIHASSDSRPPLSINDILTTGISLNAGELTITGASSTIKQMEILFSDRANCSASTLPTTAYTMVAPIIDSTGLAFTAGQTINFRADAIYKLIASTSTSGVAPTSVQCMQIYLTDNSTHGTSCVSYAGVTCDNLNQTCSTSSTQTAAWLANPTACLPFLFTSSTGSFLNQGLTNRVVIKSASTSGGVAFQSEKVWLLANAVLGIAKSKDRGVTWSNIPAGTPNVIRGVSCTGNTCVAVGASGVIRFSTVNGADWAAATGSGTVVSTAQLNGVSCSGATCVAVGNVSGTGTIAYSSDSGHTWTKSIASGSNVVPAVNLNSVSCSSSANCVVAGATGKIAYSSDGGANWTAATGTLLTSNIYNGISCVGTNCVAVGNNTSTISTSSDSGHTWGSVTTLISTGALTDVSCTNSYCVAVGTTSPNRIIRSTDHGATWSVPSTSTLTTVTPINVRCTGTTCVSGTSTSGATFGYSHDSGNSWALTSNIFGAGSINQIYCTDATCLAVLSTGTFRSTDRGATWASVTGATTGLNGVTCNGTTCITVGTGGAIFQSTTSGSNSSWVAKTSNTTTNLTGVSCDGNVCLAVGDVPSGQSQGFIGVSSNTGATWATVTSNSNQNLNAVNCKGGTCIAVGQTGKIVRSTDAAHTTWSVASSSGSVENFQDVACVNNTTCVACGTDGIIVRTTNSGDTWSTVYTISSVRLNGIACTGSTCFVVGNGGNMRISTDSGANWTALLPLIVNFTLPSVAVF